MKLTVEFQGLCMFVTCSKNLESVTVVLPAATKKRPLKDDLDGDQHAANLIIGKPADLSSIVYPMNGCKVSFMPTNSTENTSIGSTLRASASVIRMSRFAKGLKPDYKEHADQVAATVGLDGGSFDIIDSTGPRVRWEFSPLLAQGPVEPMTAVAESITWILQADSVLLEVLPFGFNEGARVEFKKDTSIIIGNRCELDPREWGKRDSKACAGETCRDLDFRWFFEVLESKTTETIRRRIKGEILPHPVAHSLGTGAGPATGASTPTCLSCESCCEEDDC